jgi:hypothetical protein
VPNVVLDELFDLVLPGWTQHVLLDALHSNHQPSHVLDEDVIAGYEELLLGLGVLRHHLWVRLLLLGL